jgi:hypothetical protein
MKLSDKFIFALAAMISTTLLAGCSKPDADDSAATPAKAVVQSTGGVKLDQETQERIGLKIELPLTTQWQPELKGYGRVIDAATLAAAVADLESTRAAAEVSRKDYDRQKTLAAQANASARALESAQSTSTHDELAFESALAKFKLDWGSTLADAAGKILSDVVNGTAALVRIDLPAGEVLSAPPASARILTLTDEVKPVTGVIAGATDGVNPQTQSQGFFFLVKGQPLPPGAAVTGFLKTSGEPVNGVIVPAEAVLRYEGKGWIYVQTAATEFTRREIPLDRLMENGWFVSENLSATNRIVVSGAQTILSAEMSGGDFNTGTRD